ncbi:MAG: energy-coupling factor transporter transmembrane protein EcfT [Oscillospiraceae bacterium]|nr:energy-coupling factor transporter transmembrane protein EcfT [Oscillospiraceae bacterium]
MKENIRQIYALEQLSSGQTVVHRIHAMAKLITTLVYITTIVSFDRYSFFNLIPYLFYPTLLMALSETPYGILLSRLLVVLPFSLFAASASLLLERNSVFMFLGLKLSYGVVSFSVILFRSYLVVMALLLLVATTPFVGITDCMRRMKIPSIFIVVTELIYRFLSVIYDQTYSMYLAYSLRKQDTKGLALKDCGSFTGQLLLRSFERAGRIYTAMSLRGYMQKTEKTGLIKMTRGDFFYCTVSSLVFILLRLLAVDSFRSFIYGGFR